MGVRGIEYFTRCQNLFASYKRKEHVRSSSKEVILAALIKAYIYLFFVSLYQERDWVLNAHLDKAL